MRRSSIRPLALGCALALSPLTVACSSGTVAPLPVRTASPSGPGAVSDVPVAVTSSPAARVRSARVTSPPEQRDPAPRPTKARTERPRAAVEPTNESACMGAEIYEVEVEGESLQRAESGCMKVGGVLRVQGLHHSRTRVTVTPESAVTQHYEPGMLDIRFLRRATVEVRVLLEGQWYPITMVII